MTAAGWDPPPEVGGAPAGKGGGDQGADGGQHVQTQDTALVCPVYLLPDGQLLQCRSVEPWTPTRGYANRRAAALRLPPLPSGRHDPDGPRTDAPDIEYLRALRDRDRLWRLAAVIADGDDPGEAAR